MITNLKSELAALTANHARILERLKKVPCGVCVWCVYGVCVCVCVMCV